MLPIAIPLWLLGTSTLAGAAAYFMKSDSKNPIATTHENLTPWKALDDFRLILATSIFLIDGTLSPEEEKFLEDIYKKAPPASIEKVNKALAEENLFAALRRWHRALNEQEARQVDSFISELVKVDGQLTEEEVAFLVQFSQICDGNEPLELFVSKSPTGAQPKHGLFQYISKSEFSTSFPKSDCAFREAEIYIEHPFIENALEQFSVDRFKIAQETMYEGIIGLMKDLGAKRILISDNIEEKEDDSDDISAGAKVSAGAGPAKIGVSAKAGYKVSAKDLMQKKQAVEVTFEGSKPGIIDRILKSRWKNRMLSRYAANKQYKSIIEGRFGDNRIKTYSYRMASKDAKNLAKAITAAASMDKKLIKTGVDMKIKSESATVQIVEKKIQIWFH